VCSGATWVAAGLVSGLAVLIGVGLTVGGAVRRTQRR
jgi:hypothetical protein